MILGESVCRVEAYGRTKRGDRIGKLFLTAQRDAEAEVRLGQIRVEADGGAIRANCLVELSLR